MSKDQRAKTSCPFSRFDKVSTCDRHYTVSQKNKTSPNIDRFFQTSFTVRFSRKCVTNPYTNTPPHAKRVVTLPCEISVFRKSPFLRSK